ncbi:MAG: lysophospholipase [Ruminococcaceae bacterium]|nr:lysophospholipase [Oscillospiraceae bacterium]
MKTILFQGDSITDCGWDRNNPNSLGQGYAQLVAAELGFEAPGEYTFYNRGISGNRIVDLYARIKADIINLKPDYMSILIGVNDVWHEIMKNNGVDAEKFEKIYTMLLEEVLQALPNLKIFLIAPYVVKGSSTDNTQDAPNRFQIFREEVDKRIAAVEKLGEKFHLPVLHLQEKFDEHIAKNNNASYWVRDGVHPALYGHELIAREWLHIFRTL